MGDPLDVAAVRSNLRGTRLRGPLIYHKVTGSTNDDALALAAEGAEEGAIIIAEEQTAGRGRQGRSWLSPRYQGLLFSVLLRPALPPAEFPLLVNMAGVAVAAAIARACGRQAGTRWPNDIVMGGRKVGGLLIEAQAPRFAVVGIGLNVLGRAADLPEEIRGTAGTLAEQAGVTVTREVVLAETINQLDEHYDLLLGEQGGAILARQRELETSLGRPVRVTIGHRQVLGVVAGLADNGGLILQTEQGEQVLTVGEVELVYQAFPEDPL
jgi:BirA family biotin operon repressor/biotin-[acetyl-CoA-carboxylase] ligase